MNPASHFLRARAMGAGLQQVAGWSVVVGGVEQAGRALLRHTSGADELVSAASSGSEWFIPPAGGKWPRLVRGVNGRLPGVAFHPAEAGFRGGGAGQLQLLIQPSHNQCLKRKG